MGDKLANPAPLGLMGFGMTTVLLNLHNAGFFALGSMILAMGLLYGGFAQVIAGIMEFRRDNTFGTTAFTSYGLFWFSLVTLVLIPKITHDGTPLWSGPSQLGMVAYLFMWGLFTAYMFIGTLKVNRSLQLIFLTLIVLFWLLAVGEYIPIVHRIAGYEGIFCGFSAIYLACAEILNEVYGKTVFPVGPVT